VAKTLAQRGITTFAVIPQDRLLQAISVDELAGVLGGEAGMILTSENSSFVSFCEDFDGTAKGNLGTTGAGGFCPRTPGYWKTHACKWPVRWLTLGGVRYDSEALMRMLSNKAPDGQKAANDASVKLAKFMIATKFDLLSGSAPMDIVQTLVEADILLAAFPPGSNPDGDLELEMLALKDLLDAYCNSQECDDPCGGDDEDDEDGDDDGCGGDEDDEDNEDNGRDCRDRIRNQLKKKAACLKKIFKHFRGRGCR